jgi:hypothetical protein
LLIPAMVRTMLAEPEALTASPQHSPEVFRDDP